MSGIIKTPTDFSIYELGKHSVTLSWSAVEDATGYRIYRNNYMRADISGTSFTDDIVAFDYYEYSLTSYNDLGESDPAGIAVQFVPDNPVLYLITDRTLNDVNRADQLNKLWVEGIFTGTTEELTEWFGNLKGAYNSSDLNRVGYANWYVASKLIAFEHPIEVSPKTDWKENDIPTPEQMKAYLDDISEIRGALSFVSSPDVPENPEGFLYSEANAIEQILANVASAVARMRFEWTYSGEAFAGEV